MDVLVYHQAFDLMKHWGVGLVRIRAVRATGYHDAMRRRAFLHGPNLHRRGVCAQYHGHAIIALRQIEGILHLPGWMFGWDVQGGKIMEIIFDIRTFGDSETHIRKDGGNFVHHLADRMYTPLWLLSNWQGDVDTFCC